MFDKSASMSSSWKKKALAMCINTRNKVIKQHGPQSLLWPLWLDRKQYETELPVRSKNAGSMLTMEFNRQLGY
jgi:hypothetical protein